MSAAKRDEPTGSTQDETAENEGKGRPTPSRRAVQAANARPIVGSQDKELRKQQRAAQNEARERARTGMMAGEERYLTVRDRGPQRRFVRDYVDARWSAGELLIPVMVLFLIVAMLPGWGQVYGVFFVWGFLFLAIIDAVVLTFILKKKLTQKFGEGNVQPGFKWYGAMRAMQFRMLRMPKPQVKRGKYPN
ncbi:hypothetical protein ACI1US_01554 [Leucobacter sp. BZR 635]